MASKNDAYKGPMLSLQTVGNTRGDIKTILRLSPPMAHSLEDVVANTRQRTSRQLPEGVVDVVSNFVSSEDPRCPYDDRAILQHVSGAGYAKLTTRDIAFARRRVGIQPASERHQY
jgi:hypothetical protein